MREAVEISRTCTCGTRSGGITAGYAALLYRVNERDKLKLQTLAGFVVFLAFGIAVKKCEFDHDRERRSAAFQTSTERVRLPAFEIGPRHYGLQHCIERSKETPTNANILMRYYLEDSCERAFDRAAADLEFSHGAREAFTRLSDRQHTLRLRLELVERDAPIDEVTLLAKPRLRAAYQLDPFMPEIQRIAPSYDFPEAAPTGPVAPIR